MTPATVIDLVQVRANRHPTGLFAPLVRAEDLTGPGLAALAEDLIAIMHDENRLLAAGLPASLTRTVDRKTLLADHLAQAWASARPLPRDQAEALVEVVARLGATARENAGRLEAALAASRRRIDAVLSSVTHQTLGRMPG